MAAPGQDPQSCQAISNQPEGQQNQAVRPPARRTIEAQLAGENRDQNRKASDNEKKNDDLKSPNQEILNECIIP